MLLSQSLHRLWPFYCHVYLIRCIHYSFVYLQISSNGHSILFCLSVSFCTFRPLCHSFQTFIDSRFTKVFSMCSFIQFWIRHHLSHKPFQSIQHANSKSFVLHSVQYLVVEDNKADLFSVEEKVVTPFRQTNVPMPRNQAWPDHVTTANVRQSGWHQSGVR